MSKCPKNIIKHTCFAYIRKKRVEDQQLVRRILDPVQRECTNIRIDNVTSIHLNWSSRRETFEFLKRCNISIKQVEKARGVQNYKGDMDRLLFVLHRLLHKEEKAATN